MSKLTEILRSLVRRSKRRASSRRSASPRGRFTPLESRCLLSHSPAPVDPSAGWLDLETPDWSAEIPRWSSGDSGEIGIELPGLPGGAPPDQVWDLQPPPSDLPIDDELGGYIDLNAPAESGPAEDTATPMVGDASDREVRQVRDVLASLRFTPAAMTLPEAARTDDARRLAAHDQLFATSDIALHEPVAAEPDANGGMIELTPAAAGDEAKILVTPREMKARPVGPVEMDSAYGRFQAFEVSTSEESLLPQEAMSPGSNSPRDTQPVDGQTAEVSAGDVPVAVQAEGRPEESVPFERSAESPSLPNVAVLDRDAEELQPEGTRSEAMRPQAPVNGWGFDAPASRQSLTAAIASVALVARATRTPAARSSSAARFLVSLRPRKTDQS